MITHKDILHKFRLPQIYVNEFIRKKIRGPLYTACLILEAYALSYFLFLEFNIRMYEDYDKIFTDRNSREFEREREKRKQNSQLFLYPRM